MLNKNAYIKTIRRVQPPLYDDFLNNDTSKYFTPFTIEKFQDLTDFIKIDYHFYIPIIFLKKVEDRFKEKFLNKKYLMRWEKLCKEKERLLIAATKKGLPDFSKALKAYVPLLRLAFQADFVAERIKKLLSQKINEEISSALLDKLNSPLRDNYYRKETADLIKTRDIKKHVRHYEWIMSRYGQEIAYTEKEAKNKLKKIDARKYFLELKAQKDEIRKVIKETKKLLGEKNAFLVDFMQFLVFYRTQRTDIIYQAGYLFIPRLKELARENGLTYEQILHCSQKEILEGLPSTKIINARIKDHVTLMEDGKMKFLVGEEAERIKEIFVDEVDSDVIGGKVAYKGKIQGRVRLVFTTSDFKKIKEGDILVSSMTTPNMLVLMKKAAAIITDEGGITCHAAIISRELKKPCIIGTKSATQILKDGDLVEVDANSGMVKILKRA